MKVLVFGAGGQIGREVCRAAWPPRYAIMPLDENAVEITKSAAVTAMLPQATHGSSRIKARCCTRRRNSGLGFGCATVRESGVRASV